MDNNENSNEMQNMVDMTGVWFVYFGVEKILEGSRVLTLTGLFNKERLLDDIINHIFTSLPEEVQIPEYRERLVIRNFNKIGETIK